MRVVMQRRRRGLINTLLINFWYTLQWPIDVPSKSYFLKSFFHPRHIYFNTFSNMFYVTSITKYFLAEILWQLKTILKKITLITYFRQLKGDTLLCSQYNRFCYLINLWDEDIKKLIDDILYLWTSWDKWGSFCFYSFGPGLPVSLIWNIVHWAESH